MKLLSLLPFQHAGWNLVRNLRELEGLLGNFLVQRAGILERSAAEAMESTDWTPAVEVSEDMFEFLVTVDLPGLKKEQVKVVVTSGKLVISGDRHPDGSVERKVHRAETKYGKFRRTFRLPDSVIVEKVNAEMAEGVLVIHLPKGGVTSPLVTRVNIT